MRFWRFAINVLMLIGFSGLLKFSGSAQAVTFNNVVTLGDSLLDDTSGGRSPVAAEHVANRLGVSVTKFAESGSTSDNLIVSGQHTQAATQFGTGDLAMLWIGGNDFFTNPIAVASGDSDFLNTLESNVDQVMSTLSAAGIEIVAFNLPDMAEVPGVISAVNLATFGIPLLRDNALENITEETIAWNSRLADLADTYNATVVDVFGLFNELKADPSSFALLGNDPILNADTGCQFCVFFDDFLLPDVHPSSFAQAFIANEAIESINQSFDPSATMPLQPLSIIEIAALADVFASDFDGNNLVDGGDLSQWQAGYGQAGADADGDGDSDGDDFLIWQSQVNSTGSLAASSVPEPAGSTLAIGFLVLGITSRRRMH